MDDPRIVLGKSFDPQRRERRIDIRCVRDKDLRKRRASSPGRRGVAPQTGTGGCVWRFRLRHVSCSLSHIAADTSVSCSSSRFAQSAHPQIANPREAGGSTAKHRTQSQLEPLAGTRTCFGSHPITPTLKSCDGTRNVETSPEHRSRACTSPASSLRRDARSASCHLTSTTTARWTSSSSRAI